MFKMSRCRVWLCGVFFVLSGFSGSTVSAEEPQFTFKVPVVLHKLDPNVKEIFVNVRLYSGEPTIDNKWTSAVGADPKYLGASNYTKIKVSEVDAGKTGEINTIVTISYSFAATSKIDPNLVTHYGVQMTFWGFDGQMNRDLEPKPDSPYEFGKTLAGAALKTYYIGMIPK